MIETYADGGVLTERLTLDGGYERFEAGVVVEQRALTDDERTQIEVAVSEGTRAAAAAASAQQDGSVRRDLMIALSKGRTYATALAADPTGDHASLRDGLATAARDATLAYSTLVFQGQATADTDRIAFLVQARIADLREIEKALGL